MRRRKARTKHEGRDADRRERLFINQQRPAWQTNRIHILRELSLVMTVGTQAYTKSRLVIDKLAQLSLDCAVPGTHDISNCFKVANLDPNVKNDDIDLQKGPHLPLTGGFIRVRVKTSCDDDLNPGLHLYSPTTSKYEPFLENFGI